MAYIKGISNFTVMMSCETPHVCIAGQAAGEENLKTLILIKYAGAAAEELILGRFHPPFAYSPDSDFYSATEMIKAYIVMTEPDTSKSMLNEELGPLTVKYSKEFYAEAKDLIGKNTESVKLVASKLMDKKVMDRKEIAALLN